MNKEEIDKWLNNWLIEENMKKDKEIERLNNNNQAMQEEMARTWEKLDKANNIINELEKWCLSWKENDKYCYLASNDKDKCRYDIWEEVLDKLQELKGDSSNE